MFFAFISHEDHLRLDQRGGGGRGGETFKLKEDGRSSETLESTPYYVPDAVLRVWLENIFIPKAYQS